MAKGCSRSSACRFLNNTESEPLFQDQILRKRCAEAVLADHSVPINPHLPYSESGSKVTIRSAQEIAERQAQIDGEEAPANLLAAW